MIEASENDFEWLFGIAKAHNLSLENVKEIAQIELGKPLNAFNKQEIIDFGKRICNAAHGPLKAARGPLKKEN